ncbi:MAG: C39 family peptidase [Anaerolineae bacterium]|nr:C39 family peptidase [Anaerolineae bacterium]
MTKTGKRATKEYRTQVPNDHQRLGYPSDVNMRLSGHGARRRRRMPGWMKALLAMATGTFAFGMVMLVIFIIAFPPFFRDLEPRYQQRLIDMFPPFDQLRPTVPFEVIPTLGGADNGDAAQQLLMTVESVTTPEPADGQGAEATPVPSLTPSGNDVLEGIPAGVVPTDVNAPTFTPSPLPEYVSPTPLPAQAAVVQPTWTPAFIPTEIPLPKSALLDLNRVKYEVQLWNNCGPTTMTMALSYYGWTREQTTAANWMKLHTEEKNVSPRQMVDFVNLQAFHGDTRSLFRYGGTTTVLKRLLAAGFPVVVEESIQPESGGWMGHYVLLVGYDDYEQHFLTFDSYLGSNQNQGRPSPYSAFDGRWRHFNRVFMVVYPQSRELDLREALGEYVSPEYGYQAALAAARDDASRDGDDRWAWFNMGTAYVERGQYDNAAIAYDQALQLNLPFRMMWYQFGPFEAYYSIGEYTNVRALADVNIANTRYVEESYYWKGMAYAAEGDTSRALEMFDLALRYNSNFTSA